MYLNKYLRSGISRLRQTASGAGNFIVFLMRRAQSDTIFRVAASLSYTSLIAIVPLLAIGLAIFSAFPVFQGAKEQLHPFCQRQSRQSPLNVVTGNKGCARCGT